MYWCIKAIPHTSISNRCGRVKPALNEKTRRLWAASEAMELGYGGISAVSRATGISAKTIKPGIVELEAGVPGSAGSSAQRKAGGGRKRLTEKHPGLSGALDKLLGPYTGGDPVRPLGWTCKSAENLARELQQQGFSISADSVGRMLKERGYSLQSNRKRFEGSQHPGRDAQFEYTNQSVEAFQAKGCPVISVDTKKKELVGNYRNAGQEWSCKGQHTEVEAYGFINGGLGKAVPYGVYGTNLNLGWVSVGTDHDTAEFAAKSVSRWWEEMGEWLYPGSKEILILAGGGGSNGWRNRLWKKSLQQWADQEGLTLMVCHFPPGTSKWNRIEHRMFSHITRNWRGKPLISHEVIVNLISATTTNKGLKIKAELDEQNYPLGKKVSDGEMESLALQKADFHGEWNYSISPRVN